MSSHWWHICKSINRSMIHIYVCSMKEIQTCTFKHTCTYACVYVGMYVWLPKNQVHNLNCPNQNNIALQPSRSAQHIQKQIRCNQIHRWARHKLKTRCENKSDYKSALGLPGCGYYYFVYVKDQQSPTSTVGSSEYANLFCTWSAALTTTRNSNNCSSVILA